MANSTVFIVKIVSFYEDEKDIIVGVYAKIQDAKKFKDVDKRHSTDSERWIEIEEHILIK